jgi:hypothetical protein
MPNIDRDFMWLSNLDTKRRLHYLEKDQDNRTHFLHCVEEDLISNAIYLDYALRYVPEDTVGTASSCRSIMEAFVLIEAIQKGDIPKENYARFRDEHIFIEYANGKKEMDSILKYADDGTWNTLVSDYNRLSRKCSEELGISLDKFSDYSKNPLFVLFRKGDKGLKNFDSLIQEYFPDELDAYRFLGMEIHPHFFMDDKLIKKEKKQLKDLSYSLLTRTMSYLKSHYSEDMKNGPAKPLSETVQDPLYFKPWLDFLTLQRNLLLNYLYKSIVYPTGIDAFHLYIMEKAIYLYEGMESMAILGFREHSMMKFKSVAENLAYLFLMESGADGMKEFNAQKEAYNISSELQYLRTLKAEEGACDDLLKRLEVVFESYYKDKYKVPFKEFKDNILRNSKYFFSSDKDFTFKRLVQEFLTKYFEGNTSEANLLSIIYDTSIDMEHAGGYLMESSFGPWQADYEPIMGFIHAFFQEWMALGIQSRKEHGLSIYGLEEDFQNYQNVVEYVALLRATSQTNQQLPKDDPYNKN